MTYDSNQAHPEELDMYQRGYLAGLKRAKEIQEDELRHYKERLHVAVEAFVKEIDKEIYKRTAKEMDRMRGSK